MALSLIKPTQREIENPPAGVLMRHFSIEQLAELWWCDNRREFSVRQRLTRTHVSGAHRGRFPPVDFGPFQTSCCELDCFAHRFM